jgi:hypothetical protein
MIHSGTLLDGWQVVADNLTVVITADTPGEPLQEGRCWPVPPEKVVPTHPYLLRLGDGRDLRVVIIDHDPISMVAYFSTRCWLSNPPRAAVGRPSTPTKVRAGVG